MGPPPRQRTTRAERLALQGIALDRCQAAGKLCGTIATPFPQPFPQRSLELLALRGHLAIYWRCIHRGEHVRDGRTPPGLVRRRRRPAPCHRSCAQMIKGATAGATNQWADILQGNRAAMQVDATSWQGPARCACTRRSTITLVDALSPPAHSCACRLELTRGVSSRRRLGAIKPRPPAAPREARDEAAGQPVAAAGSQRRSRQRARGCPSGAGLQLRVAAAGVAWRHAAVGVLCAAAAHAAQPHGRLQRDVLCC